MLEFKKFDDVYREDNCTIEYYELFYNHNRPGSYEYSAKLSLYEAIGNLINILERIANDYSFLINHEEYKECYNVENELFDVLQELNNIQKLLYIKKRRKNEHL